MKECQLCKNCFTDDVNTCPNDGMPTFHSISGEPVLEGKYHLECRIGQGGMGVVYKAKHAYLKTQHAIKVILPDLVGNDPELVTRFRQEALAAAAIRHQNVVGVSDYGVAQGTMPFLVMEYVEGESLHDLLEREKKLPPEKALELMCAIGAGIGAAHDQGIVHRDLKPLNVMILKDKEKLSEAVKILDFGLAKIKSGELLGSFIQAQTTGLMGSPYYMAPEQWADEEPSATSDIYSLGVILFQMLAGDVPFKGSSIPAIMKKHVSDLPPKFAELGVKVNPQIERAVRHSLAKDRKDRPQSVKQFINELTQAVNSTSSLDAAKIPGMLQQEKPDVTASLQVLTIPPQSQVFVDNVAVGNSRPDGWLLLEGLQSGKHHIRVRHEGFVDFESEFDTDGSPKEVVAQLTRDTGAIPKPMSTTMPAIEQSMQNTPQSLSNTQGMQTMPHQTGQQPYLQTGQQSIQMPMPTQKSAFSSPFVLALIGIFGLLLLSGIGFGGAWLAGLFEPQTPPINTNSSPIQSPTSSGKEEIVKNELIMIPGGKFIMGRDEDGKDGSTCAHEVEVKEFWIDKYEITNAEYYDFVKATDYKAPTSWTTGGKPAVGEENLPVVRVSIIDANAFAEWRSKRDKRTYRLPTEQEWEYAARNGEDNNLYPWKDDSVDDRAVVDQTTLKSVGSKPKGANKWGVQDLIGNAWEWTGSEISKYPCFNVEFKKPARKEYVIRGGGFKSKLRGDDAVNSITRLWVESTREDGFLGFRLVTSKK